MALLIIKSPLLYAIKFLLQQFICQYINKLSECHFELAKTCPELAKGTNRHTINVIDFSQAQNDSKN
jgi:hypothetical protein